MIKSLWVSVGFSFLRLSLLVCWYQKNALIGFLGASWSFFLLVFFWGFSGFSSLPAFLGGAKGK